MLPDYYEFFNPVKVIAGNKALENIPFELTRLHVKRPIILTDKGVSKAGLIKVVLDSFGDSDVIIGAICDDITSDSPVDLVNATARIFRDKQCDSLIAVGGGSVIDTAKGVNTLVSEGSDDIMKFRGVYRLTVPQRPLIAVPTTAGSGSEATMVAMIYSPVKKLKIPFVSILMLPEVAILDPRMTLSLPPKLTAATGMDALSHAVEAYSGLQKNPLSDAYAVSAINLIRENLVNSVKDGKDKDARFAMANASLIAGIAFSNSMVGATHSIGHACGALACIHHGTAMAMLLPVVMEYNSDKVSQYYGELLLPLAGDETFARTPVSDRARKSIQVIRDLNSNLNKLCGLPLSLKEAGVKEDQIEEIAKAAISDGSLVFNPEEVEFEDALKILKAAY